MSHHCVSGTTLTTACCMNACTMAFVLKEDPEGTDSLLKIFLMTILIHTLETLHLLEFCFCAVRCQRTNTELAKPKSGAPNFLLVFNDF